MAYCFDIKLDGYLFFATKISFGIKQNTAMLLVSDIQPACGR